MNKISKIYNELQTIIIFKKLMKNKIFKSFFRLCETKKIKYYSDIISVAYQNNSDFTNSVLEQILENENICVQQACKKEKTNDILFSQLTAELKILQQFSQLTKADFEEYLGCENTLSDYTTQKLDFNEIYKSRLENIDKVGFGIFSKYSTFILSKKGLKPVQNQDNVEMQDFSGYQAERDKIVKNTMVLVNEGIASNALLYGDAGTGKSSTVKAVAKHFVKDGLRLIEVKKKDLYLLPKTIDQLNQNPLKFIIFIDDLSFTQNDDNFAALKAILEGSVAGANNNIAVYATSNRRHLIKENFQDRLGDEIHENDTKEELISLSARFGLKVTFSKPDKQVYLEIVKDQAKLYNIDMDPQALGVKAEAFALRAGGRSPRVAKQFIKCLLSKVIE